MPPRTAYSPGSMTVPVRWKPARLRRCDQLVHVDALAGRDGLERAADELARRQALQDGVDGREHDGGVLARRQSLHGVKPCSTGYQESGSSLCPTIWKCAGGARPIAASHRGTKEMDIILGRYAAARLPPWQDEELSAFERLLALPDPLLTQWFSERATADAGEFAGLIVALRAPSRIGAGTGR